MASPEYTPAGAPGLAPLRSQASARACRPRSMSAANLQPFSRNHFNYILNAGRLDIVTVIVTIGLRLVIGERAKPDKLQICAMPLE